MRKINHFIFWSNGFFAIPFSFALFFGVFPHALIIALTTLTSCIYHFYHEEKFFRFDKIMAWLLMLTNLSLIWRAGFPFFHTAITFSTAAVAIYFHTQKRRRLFYHGLWHMTASTVTLLSLLTYTT